MTRDPFPPVTIERLEGSMTRASTCVKGYASRRYRDGALSGRNLLADCS